MCSAGQRSIRARATRSRRRRAGGFSLLESLAAAGLLSVVLLGLAASAISLTRNEKSADSTSAAHGLVQQQLERLRSMPLGAAALAPGNYTDPANPIRADGTTGGPYTRTWAVSANDTPGAGLRTVIVTVAWRDSRSHTTTAAAYVRCSSIPC